MTEPDEISAIFQRIETKKYSDSDIQRLKELVRSGDAKTIEQLGKYNTAIEGSDSVQVGDKISNINIVYGEPRNHEPKQSGSEEIPYSWKPLKLKIDPEVVVNSINTSLLIVSNLRKSARLSGDIEKEFTKIRRQLLAMESIEEELVDIKDRASALVDRLVEYLEQDLEHLNDQHKEYIDGHERELEAQGIQSTEAYLEATRTFQEAITYGEIGANWIDSNLFELSSRATQYAIEEILSGTNQRFNEQETEDFCFSIEEYLRGVSHCLKWGRYNILDSLNITPVLEEDLYIKAFSYVEEATPMHLPEPTRDQVKDYINYIIEKVLKQ